MATAAGITLDPRPVFGLLSGQITTTDANLSLVTVRAGVFRVRVEVRGAGGDGDGQIQFGGAQGGAPASTGNTVVYATGAIDVYPAQVGQSPSSGWSFTVCRNASTNAVFIFQVTAL